MTATLLVQPPFFRQLGSHNDRGPLDLAYLAGHLSQTGEVEILNLDWTGASVYCQWEDLFRRSHMLEEQAILGSPVLLEALERIMSFDPSRVIVAMGDSLTPWVDLGNAFIGAELARMLAKVTDASIYGVGPRTEDLSSAMRSVFTSVSLSTYELYVRYSGRDISRRGFYETLPIINEGSDQSKYDVLMTALGCPRACAFCGAADQPYQQLALSAVSRDLASRNHPELDIGDAIFLPSGSRLDQLMSIFEAHPSRTYSCELTVEHVTLPRLRALRSLGVREIKIGVESGVDADLSLMGKKSSQHAIRDACALVQESGFVLTIYVLLGGPIPDPLGSAWRTLDLCRAITAANNVVNVWAYEGDVRATDCHFSWDLVSRYGLEPVMDGFFELPTSKPTLGSLRTIA